MSVARVTLITPKRFGDDRGWFCESFNARTFASAVGALDFVQDNHSYSRSAGTLRGLHFQTPPHAQAKLVRCVRGAIWDVAVDLRHGSPTYGRHVTAVLSRENWRQVWIPTGFAHGYCTLSEASDVLYKVDARYERQSEGGLLWSDPDIGVQWPMASPPLLSEKDMRAMKFTEFTAKHGSLTT